MNKKIRKTIKLLALTAMVLGTLGLLSLWFDGYHQTLASILGISEEESNKISFWKMVPELVGFKGEKTYLVLFQNNMELRPSGGYLGNFAIVKVRNGQPTAMGIHDTNIFDGFGTVQTDPPQAIRDYLGQTNWQMRDGNWSPDFPTSAQRVENFYHMQGGTDEFDGIIAVNANILPSLLDFTGPIYLEDYDITFESKDVLYQLEYEVEKGYYHDRGMEPGERKNIFKDLAMKVTNELNKKAIWKSSELKDMAMELLNNKTIQIYLKNEQQQETIAKLNWAGEVNQGYKGNYLMLVEANTAALKSNAFIDRNIEYYVDFSKHRPEVYVKINFNHSNLEKSWFNDDYRCYLRLYLPQGSWLVRTAGMSSEIKFLDELNKTVLGSWITVPAGEQKSVEYKFLLPVELKESASYKILVQKQSGVDEIPFKYTAKEKDSSETIIEKVLKTDWYGSLINVQ